MSNKTNIEEDIKIVENLIYTFKENRELFYSLYENHIYSIENILADREEWKTKSEWFKRCCNKNFDTDQQLQAKANKYDSLVKRLKEDIEYGKKFESQLEPTIPEIRAEYAQELLDTES